MWDLPGPGIKPVSPALAGGFLTTVPPGKSKEIFVICILFPLQFGSKTITSVHSFIEIVFFLSEIKSVGYSDKPGHSPFIEKLYLKKKSMTRCSPYVESAVLGPRFSWLLCLSLRTNTYNILVYGPAVQPDFEYVNMNI